MSHHYVRALAFGDGEEKAAFQAVKRLIVSGRLDVGILLALTHWLTRSMAIGRGGAGLFTGFSEVGDIVTGDQLTRKLSQLQFRDRKVVLRQIYRSKLYAEESEREARLAAEIGGADRFGELVTGPGECRVWIARN
jgi:hypothetical protein